MSNRASMRLQFAWDKTDNFGSLDTPLYKLVWLSLRQRIAVITQNFLHSLWLSPSNTALKESAHQLHFNLGGSSHSLSEWEDREGMQN